MRPMLDDLELPQVQEIASYDRRALAEHKPPGMAGSLLQNMGRRPARLALWGVAAADDALDFVEKLNELFKAGEPVPFIADIIADAEIEQVVIDDLQWQELAGKPDRYAFILTLREYIEPVEPEDTSLVDDVIGDDVTGLMEDLATGLDLMPFFSSGLERFIDPLTNLLGRVQAANQHTS